MTSRTLLSSASKPDCFSYVIFFSIAYRELLDHVAVTLGLFVVQTKLRMLISRDVLNIYPAYAEWVWHFLGFRVSAESIIFSFLLVRPKTIVFGRTYVLRMMFFFPLAKSPRCVG